MDTLEADLAVIRSLDALPEARRRYLAVLAADAGTDADRARIVFAARHEDRRVREKADADFSAELHARARWAEYNPAKSSDPPLRPSGRRIVRDDSATPRHRPVIVRYIEPTKTPTQGQARERRRLNEPVRHHGSAPGAPERPVPRVRVLPEHGTISRYTNQKCRCADCRAAKSATNRHEREARAAKRAERAAMRSGILPQ